MEAQYGEVTLIVRRARVRDNNDRTRMAVRLAPLVKDDAILDNDAWTMLTLATRTEQVAGLVWRMPGVEDSAEQLFASLQTFLEQDAGLVEFWEALVEQANEPLNHLQLAPPDAVPDSEKKATPPNAAPSASASTTA